MYFFVDPMGYKNLSVYDISLLNNIDLKLEYYTNFNFEYTIAVPTYKIYSYSEKTGINKLISYTLSQLRLLKNIKKKKPVLVHFQWLKLPWLDIILLKILKRSAIKTVLTAHNLLPHDSGNKFYKVYKKIYNSVDQIIVHEENSARELVEKFSIPTKKINIIPHGLISLATTNQSDVKNISNKLIEELNLNNKTIYSFLGGIGHYKGIDLVIKAWNKISDSTKHLIIAGKGGGTYLNELVDKDNVTLINRFLSNEEFEAFLEVSDYILLPYRRISQSGVLLSALKKRKKIITTNQGGLTEPLKFGKIGYVLDELSEAELLRVIELAHSEKFEVNTLTWKRIEEYYDWKKIGEQTKMLYLSL